MSVTFFLVKFELDSGSAYLDGKSDLIEFVDVPIDIFHALVAEGGGIQCSKLEIFENETRSASYQIDCYVTPDVDRLRARLRKIILNKIKESAAELSTAFDGENDVRALEAIMGMFKVLTNLDYLLTRKLNGYRDDDSIVVRVSGHE